VDSKRETALRLLHSALQQTVRYVIHYGVTGGILTDYTNTIILRVRTSGKDPRRGTLDWAFVYNKPRLAVAYLLWSAFVRVRKTVENDMRRLEGKEELGDDEPSSSDTDSAQ